MIAPIEFFAAGCPKGQPRVKAFARKMGAQYVARVFTPGTAEEWKSQIAIAAKPFIPAEPLPMPLSLSLGFFFPRPKSHFRTGKNAGIERDDAPQFHTSTPDADNLAKAAMDALSIIRFWNDDAQVSALRVWKLYCDGRGPGVQIKIAEALGGICVKWRAV